MNKGNKVNNMSVSFTFVGHEDDPGKASVIINQSKKISLISDPMVD